MADTDKPAAPQGPGDAAGEVEARDAQARRTLDMAGQIVGLTAQLAEARRLLAEARDRVTCWQADHDMVVSQRDEARAEVARLTERCAALCHGEAQALKMMGAAEAEVARLRAQGVEWQTLARNFAAWLESEGHGDNAAYIRRRIEGIAARASQGQGQAPTQGAPEDFSVFDPTWARESSVCPEAPATPAQAAETPGGREEER